jgi:hypothetical protein
MMEFMFFLREHSHRPIQFCCWHVCSTKTPTMAVADEASANATYLCFSLWFRLDRSNVDSPGTHARRPRDITSSPCSCELQAAVTAAKRSGVVHRRRFRCLHADFCEDTIALIYSSNGLCGDKYYDLNDTNKCLPEQQPD